MTIVCDTCKKEMWYGQTTSGTPWAYHSETSMPLVEFLMEHSGCDLHHYTDHGGDSHRLKDEVNDYEEIGYRDYYKKDNK